jgi:hypothetical protein
VSKCDIFENIDDNTGTGYVNKNNQILVNIKKEKINYINKHNINNS